MAPKFNSRTGEWEDLDSKPNKGYHKTVAEQRNDIYYDPQTCELRIRSTQNRASNRAATGRAPTNATTQGSIAHFGQCCRRAYKDGFRRAPSIMINIGLIIIVLILFSLSIFLGFAGIISLCIDSMRDKLKKTAWYVALPGTVALGYICYNKLSLICSILLLIGLLM